MLSIFYELLKIEILLSATPSCGEREIENEHVSPNFKVFAKIAKSENLIKAEILSVCWYCLSSAN